MSDTIRPIEPFHITQSFGKNPQYYKKYGIKGHNGWDLRTKYPDTPEGRRYILASWLSKHYKTANEGNSGFGKYFEVIVQLKNTWKLRNAHCHSVQKFDTKKEGEPMAISDNTGDSSAPHLHFDVKRVEYKNGKIIKIYDYNNGYFGCVNPQIFFDELRAYKKSNSPTPQTKISVDSKLWEIMVGQSSKLDEVHDILELPGDPKHTSIDTYKKIINGIKWDAKTVRDTNTRLEQEVENQKERAANKLEDCQKVIELREAEIDALSGSEKTWKKLREDYQTSMIALMKEKREAQKLYGKTKTELKSCQVELKSQGRDTANDLKTGVIERLRDLFTKWKN